MLVPGLTPLRYNGNVNPGVATWTIQLSSKTTPLDESWQRQQTFSASPE